MNDASFVWVHRFQIYRFARAFDFLLQIVCQLLQSPFSFGAIAFRIQRYAFMLAFLSAEFQTAKVLKRIQHFAAIADSRRSILAADIEQNSAVPRACGNGAIKAHFCQYGLQKFFYGNSVFAKLRLFLRCLLRLNFFRNSVFGCLNGLFFVGDNFRNDFGNFHFELFQKSAFLQNGDFNLVASQLQLFQSIVDCRLQVASACLSFFHNYLS